MNRGTIMWMCRDLGLCKFKENWKSILEYLSFKSSKQPPNWLVADCLFRFQEIMQKFEEHMRECEKSGRYMLKGARGNSRHNVMHLNYTHRKILESFGIWEYHREFPLLRTPAKTHALDDTMEVIMKQLGYPFQRTPVVVIPRCKQRTKGRDSHAFRKFSQEVENQLLLEHQHE